MKYNFLNKVALVTGSSNGIGAAIAVQFAQYGAQVAITGRNVENLSQIAEQIETQSHGAVKPLQIIGDFAIDDTLPKRLINETVEKFGRLDFLVNNAGGASPIGTLSSPNLLAEFDAVHRVNVRSVVELTQLAVPYLEKTKGNIINISSISAIKPMMLVYSSSKAALDMVTKTSAMELGPKGIRVNSINPGPVVTAALLAMGYSEPQSNQVYEIVTKNSLMKRIGTSQDIANLASFLASDDAKNITGSIFVSDSGELLANQNYNLQEMEKQFE